MRVNFIHSAAFLAAVRGQDLNSTIAGNSQLSQLGSLLAGQPALLSQLSSATNITILAPSNNAFGTLLNSSQGPALQANPDLLAAVLQYHVLNGTYLASAVPENLTFVPSSLTNAAYANVTGGQRIGAQRAGSNVTFYSGLLQNSTVTQANVNFTGGVIHVINSVLTLPQNVSSTLVSAGLSSLYGALNATNLLNTVDGLRDVTIFAPSNAAFQRIGSALPNLTTEQVTSILTYHVVNGTTPLYSSSLTNGSQATTLAGGQITITFGQNGRVFANGAEVVTPNVLVAGGVVHVIDNVLNPNSTTAANSTASSGTPAFSGASSVSSAPFTSGVPTATSSINTAQAPGASSTSSKALAAGMPLATGAVGIGALVLGMVVGL